MAAGETVNGSSARPLPTMLFWAGVGLAPFAAGILLLGGSSGALRVGMLLVLLVVLLIGGSVRLRSSEGAGRRELQQILFDEVDQLRDGLRTDIGSAIRLSQRAQSERVRQLQEQVELMAGQLRALQTELARLTRPAQQAAQSGQHGQPARHSAQHGQLVHSGQQAHSAQRGEPSRSGRYGSPVADPVTSRDQLTAGMVRHTETVSVTTRHTFVSPSDEPVQGPTGYRHPAGEPNRPQPSWSDARAGSWSGQSADAQRDSRSGRSAGSWAGAPEPAGGQRWGPAPRHGADPGWPGPENPGRWAAVRRDAREEEIRMGERHAEAYADEAGTRVRVEDRWVEARRGADPSLPADPSVPAEPEAIAGHPYRAWAEGGSGRAAQWPGSDHSAWQQPEPQWRHAGDAGVDHFDHRWR